MVVESRKEIRTSMHVLRRARRIRLRPALIGAGLLVALAMTVAPSSASAASKFYGLQAWAWPSAGEFQRMAQGGAGAFRVTFDWWRVQPGSRNRWEWGAYDQIVANASRYNLTLVPNFVGTPKWADAKGGPPRSSRARRDFAAFLRRVVARYGPQGRFRASHRGVPFKPVRYWQVWNEPNFPSYWTNRKPNARQYVSLLRLAHRAIRGEDRHARVILAGLPDSKYGVRLTTYLKQVYRVRGARKLFSAVAIHPYVRDQKGVERIVIGARRVMRRYGDRRKQLWLTEIGWASAGPRSNEHVKSRSGQAALMRRTYAMLKRRRGTYRLGMVAWFSWRDRRLYRGERDWWAPHTGLFASDGSPKPAWYAFTRIARGNPGRGRLRSAQ